MARDYAKSTAKKPRTRRTSKAKAPAKASAPWKWLLAGLLLGFLGTSGVYLYQHNPRFQQAWLALIGKQSKTTSHHAVHKKPIKVVKAPEPKFDFYTILPKQHLAEAKRSTPTMSTAAAAKPENVQPEQAAPAVMSNKENLATTTKQNAYILQVASFQGEKDADRLKAQLTLLGFNVRIMPGKAAGKTWYRVWVGPFSSRQNAQSQQKKLQSNHIKSLLRQITT